MTSKTGMFFQSTIAALLLISGFSTGYMFNDINNTDKITVDVPKDNYTIENRVDNGFKPEFTAKVSESNTRNFIQDRGFDLDYRVTEESGLSVESVDKPVKLSGSSMQPTMFDGNTLLAKHYQGRMDLEPGTVIGFESGDGALTLHRVKANYLSTERDYLVTQGDNSGETESVEEEQVEYVIIGVLYT